MSSTRLHLTSILFIIAFSLAVSCAKESDQGPDAARERQSSPVSATDVAPALEQDREEAARPADGRRSAGGRDDADQPGSPGQQSEGGFFTAVRMSSMLVRPGDRATDRMLEYHVNLAYQCQDFQKARAELLAVIARYGFIRSGHTDITHTSELRISAAVQAKEIYRFLLDMDRVGRLMTERINVNDLTEQMVLSQRQTRREEIRLQRKNRAMQGIAASARNWQAIENSITQSEDNLDSAEHRKWQVLDRVNWASVSISLEPYGAVHVPPYKKALYEILDLVLWIPYALIYLTPIILIFLFLRWKRHWFSWLFKKKVEEKKE